MTTCSLQIVCGSNISSALMKKPIHWDKVQMKKNLRTFAATSISSTDVEIIVSFLKNSFPESKNDSESWMSICLYHDFSNEFHKFYSVSRRTNNPYWDDLLTASISGEYSANIN